MTNSAIMEQLQALLGHAVPEDYQNLCRSYPETLRHALRALDDSDSQGTVADVELISDLNSVLEINLEARSGSVPEPDGLDFYWPDQFLVIGESGDGDYFCIDAGDEDPVQGVIQFDHQSVTFELVADTLDDFVTMLVHTFVEGGNCCGDPNCDHDHDHDDCDGDDCGHSHH